MNTEALKDKLDPAAGWLKRLTAGEYLLRWEEFSQMQEGADWIFEFRDRETGFEVQLFKLDPTTWSCRAWMPGEFPAAGSGLRKTACSAVRRAIEKVFRNA